MSGEEQGAITDDESEVDRTEEALGTKSVESVSYKGKSDDGEAREVALDRRGEELHARQERLLGNLQGFENLEETRSTASFRDATAGGGLEDSISCHPPDVGEQVALDRLLAKIEQEKEDLQAAEIFASLEKQDRRLAMLLDEMERMAPLDQPHSDVRPDADASGVVESEHESSSDSFHEFVQCDVSQCRLCCVAHAHRQLRRYVVVLCRTS